MRPDQCGMRAKLFTPSHPSFFPSLFQTKWNLRSDAGRRDLDDFFCDHLDSFTIVYNNPQGWFFHTAGDRAGRQPVPGEWQYQAHAYIYCVISYLVFIVETSESQSEISMITKGVTIKAYSLYNVPRTAKLDAPAVSLKQKKELDQRLDAYMS